MKIEKGRIFIVSTGEYSDYQVWTLFRARQNLDARKLSDEYLKLHPEQKQDYSASFSQFMNWLLNVKGLVEEIEYSEWYLGDYDTIKPEVRANRCRYNSSTGQ